MPRKGKYKPVNERTPEQVEKANASVRRRRLKARLETGKMPYPHKYTPGMEAILEMYGRLGEVIVPREDQESTNRARQRATNSRRLKWNNVKFK